MYAYVCSATLKFDQMVTDYEVWRNDTGAILNTFAAVEQATVERIKNAYEKAIKRGKLRMRPLSGGDAWDEFYFVLTDSEVLVMEKNSSGQMEVFDLYEIHPSCSVFETNLGPFAFELVTSSKVLHVMSDSRESTTAWIHAIRNSISNSVPKADDPLLQAALNRLEEDVFYDVSFHEDKPLGVVLERSGEWAIVKLSNFRDTGVSIGSALTSINGESCILKPYAATIDKLKNWRPPLHLGFRRAPKKTGFLVKLARQRRGSNAKNWKRRFFVLEEGRLVYKEVDSADSPIKGDVSLMGSAVSLVSSVETGKFFCFRVVSGVTSLTMQGETLDEMMDWASCLYHAIAIANGGAHILGIERKRVDEEEARIRAKQAAIAEKARLEQERLETEAREKAEREARAKAAEEEAIRRQALAEAERLKLEEADRKQQAIEKANGQLKYAMGLADMKALSQAIEEVNTCEFITEVTLLPDATSLLLQLTERESARLEATKHLDEVLSAVTFDSLSELSEAIDRAETSNVDFELINSSRSKLSSMRHEKAMIDNVKRSMTSACEARSTSAIEEALNSAGSINYSGPELTVAQQLLVELMQEEERRIQEENERLAAEAALLDAEMEAANNENVTTDASQPQVDDDEEEYEDRNPKENSEDEREPEVRVTLFSQIDLL
jgi:hypothetical protein